MLVQLSSGEFRLDVFDNFRVDPTLPKFQKMTVSPEMKINDSSVESDGSRVSRLVYQQTSLSSPNSLMVVTGNSGIIQTNQGWMMRDNASEDSVKMPDRFLPWYSRLWKWLRSFFERKPLPVNVIFEAVASDSEELQKVEIKIEGYRALIENAKAMGQVALVESLERDMLQKFCEASLDVAGFKRFVSEKQMVAWVQRCERGLRLDWLKNFTRLIPQEVQGLKKKADGLNVFDNYVVLHYDPENKYNQWTKKEVEAERNKRRDPILFGLIQGVTNLYLVADWKDELCDLTFAEVAKALSEKETTIDIPAPENFRKK